MKTLLVPTNFSPAAEKTAFYAIKLAQQLRADVQLLYATQVEDDIPIYMLELGRLTNRLKQADNDDFKPLIKFSAFVGTEREGIKSMISGESIPLIVLSSQNSENETIRDIIEVVNVPVLLIPAESTELPNDITFATDCDPKDIEILHSLATFARDIAAGITVVHINATGQDANLLAYNRFIEKARKRIDFIGLSFTTLTGENAGDTLRNMMQSQPNGLLALSHHQKEQLEKASCTADSCTFNLTSQTTVPLMIYPKTEVPATYAIF